MKRGLKAVHSKPAAYVMIGCTNYPDEKGTESYDGILDTSEGSDVALITPMKRGLKETPTPAQGVTLSFVALITPMKRGLKDSAHGGYPPSLISVALITPMKRGLKVVPNGYLFFVNRCCTNYPDEKGTESGAWRDRFHCRR